MHELNPRVARSRRALADALVTLSQERGYKNVTITDVTQAANVSYSTFFRHYDSLDDLLASLIFPAFDELKERVSRQQTIYDEALELFHFVQEHQDLYRIYLSLPKRHTIRETIDRAALDLVAAHCERHEQTEVPFELSVEIVEAITGRLIHLFLDNVDGYTPEQMASMHYDLVVKGAAATTLNFRQAWGEPLPRPETMSAPIQETPNARAARSRQAIADAFISLVLEQGYEQVTMTAVAQRAKVSQATFYRHYRNLDDVPAQVFQRTFQQLIRRIKQQKTFDDEALAIFTYIRQHQNVFRAYVALPHEHPARWAVIDALVKFALERYEERENSRVPLELSVNHIIESSYQLVCWYLDNINEYTPQQVAAMYIDFIVHATESTALVHRRD